MDDLWTDAARAHVAAAAARSVAVDPARRHHEHLRARLARLDPDVLVTLAVRGVVAAAERILADHHGDVAAATEDALARYSAAHTLAIDLLEGPPEHPPDIWPDHRPPAPAGADDLREDITMTVQNKITNATADDDKPAAEPAALALQVPEHLRDAYARTGARSYWTTMERVRRSWRERTPENAQSPQAWAVEEHRWRLAEAERLAQADRIAAERTAAFDARRRCYCCGDGYKDTIYDDLCPRCRATLYVQQAADYATEVLSNGSRRDEAIAVYRTVRGK